MQNCLSKLFKTVVFLLVCNFSTIAQEATIPLSVVCIQDISFGAFFQGNLGGTVRVSHDNTRLLSGDIVELNISGFSHFPAIFELTGNPGSLLSILRASKSALFCSNGGSLSFQSGECSINFPTLIPPSGHIQVSVGGILSIEGSQANPSGNYAGSWEITFIQE